MNCLQVLCLFMAGRTWRDVWELVKAIAKPTVCNVVAIAMRHAIMCQHTATLLATRMNLMQKVANAFHDCKPARRLLQLTKLGSRELKHNNASPRVLLLDPWNQSKNIARPTAKSMEDDQR